MGTSASQFTKIQEKYWGWFHVNARKESIRHLLRHNRFGLRNHFEFLVDPQEIFSRFASTAAWEEFQRGGTVEGGIDRRAAIEALCRYTILS